jgi:hypothetical protein
MPNLPCLVYACFIIALPILFLCVIAVVLIFGPVSARICLVEVTVAVIWYDLLTCAGRCQGNQRPTRVRHYPAYLFLLSLHYPNLLVSSLFSAAELRKSHAALPLAYLIAKAASFGETVSLILLLRRGAGNGSPALGPMIAIIKGSHRDPPAF